MSKVGEAVIAGLNEILVTELQAKVSELVTQLSQAVAAQEKMAVRESELENEVEYWHKLWQRASLALLDKVDTATTERVAELEGHIKAILNDWYHSKKTSMPEALSAALDSLSRQVCNLCSDTGVVGQKEMERCPACSTSNEGEPK